MPNVYTDFSEAWLNRVKHPWSAASAADLHDARLRMEGHPDYDPAKYHAALFAAEAARNAIAQQRPH